MGEYSDDNNMFSWRLDIAYSKLKHSTHIKLLFDGRIVPNMGTASVTVEHLHVDSNIN